MLKKELISLKIQQINNLIKITILNVNFEVDHLINKHQLSIFNFEKTKVKLIKLKILKSQLLKNIDKIDIYFILIFIIFNYLIK